MESLLKKYVALLAGFGAASDKFWALEKRVNADKHQASVIVRMSQPNTYLNIINLLSAGVITLDDLDGFSDDLRAKIAFVMRDRD